jgi:hypothetical protein
MPLPDSGTYPVSNKDVVSFTFDNPDIPQDRPVSMNRMILSIYVSTKASSRS